MAEMLQQIALPKDKSEVFRQFEKGKRYQIILDTGESVIIAVLANGRIEESDEGLAKVSQHFAFRDEDEITSKQMIAVMSKDKELREEPIGLYSRDYGKDTL
jgi:hypothetical protein